MSGYWLGFRRNCRYNYGCPGNCYNKPVHSAHQNNQWSGNQNLQNNQHPEYFPVRPESVFEDRKIAANQLFMKSTSLGSMVIPANTVTGTIYHIASLNIQTLCFENFHIKLCFSCNLITSNAKISLGFQIFKQGNTQVESVPISCNFDFCREKESNESNIVSFIACDYDSFKYDCCNYSVFAKVTGMATSGATSITNSILSATLVEIPEDN